MSRSAVRTTAVVVGVALASIVASALAPTASAVSAVSSVPTASAVSAVSSVPTASAVSAVSSVPTASAVSAVSSVPTATTLSWGPCTQPDLADNGFECTVLRVPLDRRDAGTGTVTLALTRHPATGDADQRIGSLVFNPGGPGGSGLDAAAHTWEALTEDVRARFDLVTWDPRGSGYFTPSLHDCAQPSPRRPLTGAVDWAAVATAYAKDLATANAACQARNARIAPHMGTNENVADLDRIRAALGDERLTYWGMSYGTRIGYVYALRHPARVRAIVLDGSIDPAASTLTVVQGGSAPDQSFGSLVQAFPFVGEQLPPILARLNRKVVRLPYDQVLDRWLVRDVIGAAVPQQDAYVDIAGFVDLMHTALFGTGEQRTQARVDLATVVARLRELGGNGGNAGGAFSIVNCLDYADRPTMPRLLDAVADEQRLGPLFGGTVATQFAMGCAGLTLRPDPIPRITGATGSPVPVLILGSSRDGATSVQWTARMSRAFPASRTVTYAGGQHVVWGFARSWCVDFVADAYVMDLELPRADVGCPNVYLPE